MRIRWKVVFQVRCSMYRPTDPCEPAPAGIPAAGPPSMSRSSRSELPVAFIVVTPIQAQLRALTRRTVAVLPMPTQASAIPPPVLGTARLMLATSMSSMRIGTASVLPATLLSATTPQSVKSRIWTRCTTRPSG